MDMIRVPAGAARLPAIALIAALALLLAGPAAGSERYVSVGSWGGYGTGNGKLNDPFGIATDRAGNVYVTEYQNDRIQKFSSTGTFIAKWGREGSGNGQFQGPMGIATDRAGHVYVADTYNRRVQKFSPSGRFITKWGTSGSGDGQFITPEGIATDAAGNVYVVDSTTRLVQKFTPSGRFIVAWGSMGSGNGQFGYPHGIATDGAGNVYVTDSERADVQQFTSTGRFIRKWGTFGFGPSQFQNVHGVATDSRNHVYVADSHDVRFEPYSDRIQKFTASGAFITTWGTHGSDPGELMVPWGVATDAIGNVYVAEVWNDRIQKFAPAPPPPKAGKTANVKVVRGTVKTKCKGDKDYTRLDGTKQIRIGCLVDTLNGTVRLTTAKGTGGGTQSSDFSGGIFQVKQKAAKKPYTVLKLAGALACGQESATALLSDGKAKGQKKKHGRRLWGNGKGKFRTRGRHGSASVRGTNWLVADRCDDSTLFRVKRGKVKVRDFEKKKTVTLRKGQTYVAKNGR